RENVLGEDVGEVANRERLLVGIDREHLVADVKVLLLDHTVGTSLRPLAERTGCGGQPRLGRHEAVALGAGVRELLEGRTRLADREPPVCYILGREKRHSSAPRDLHKSAGAGAAWVAGIARRVAIADATRRARRAVSTRASSTDNNSDDSADREAA